MPTLLVVHHTTSPTLQELLEAALAGTKAEGLDGIDVVVRPALAATVSDVLAADAFVLGTPANIGYMSGALKHFFDRTYLKDVAEFRASPRLRVPTLGTIGSCLKLLPCLSRT